MSTRTIHDGLLKATTALPAAAAQANSASIDLEQVAISPVNEAFAVKVSVPALPSLANSTTATFKLQDSADDSSFDDIPELAALVMTGGGGVGAPAAERSYRLPDTARRYLRLNQAVAADGGNNTAVSSTLQLTF
jgi:hypothetical protein